MKLRLDEYTLRLRLTAEEVTAFAQQGYLATTVPLLPPLTYTLERAAVEALHVVVAPNHWRILVPAAEADAWISTAEAITLRTPPTASNAPALQVVVEKDLGCRH